MSRQRWFLRIQIHTKAIPSPKPAAEKIHQLVRAAIAIAAVDAVVGHRVPRRLLRCPLRVDRRAKAPRLMRSQS